MTKKIVWSFLSAFGIFFAASWINSNVNGCRTDFKEDQRIAYKVATYGS